MNAKRVKREHISEALNLMVKEKVQNITKFFAPAINEKCLINEKCKTNETCKISAAEKSTLKEVKKKKKQIRTQTLMR